MFRSEGTVAMTCSSEETINTYYARYRYWLSEKIDNSFTPDWLTPEIILTEKSLRLYIVEKAYRT